MTRPIRSETPSGIVLAGGRSSRYGADKLAAELDGTPLLQRAIAALAQACCEVVVVVAPDGAAALPSGAGVPLRIARDARPGGGPLVGLVAGLDAAIAPVAIVVGGDMPRLVPALLAELGRRADGGRAAALMDGAHVRPLPCALPREAAGTAARELLAAGGSSLWEVLEAVGLSSVPESEWRQWDPAGDSLIDVDRPDDLRTAQGHTGGTSQGPR